MQVPLQRSVRLCQEWWATTRSSLITHRRLKWMWLVLTPVSLVWRESTPWVVGISHYANVVGHWSSEEAALERREKLIHRVLKWVWIGLLPLTWVLRENIPWLVFMSHYAVVVGHWSSEEAARSALKQEGEYVG